MSFPFWTGFLWNNTILCVTIVLLSAAKAGLKRYTTAKFQYYIWTSLFPLLLLPLLPLEWSPLNGLGRWFPTVVKNSTASSSPDSASGFPQSIHLPADWLADFSVSAQHSIFQGMSLFLTVAWIAGILVMIALFALSGIRLHRLRYNSDLCRNEDIRADFAQCKASLKIRRNIRLYQTGKINTPISFGILHPCVILPESIERKLSKSEIHFILMHELLHYKSMDILINYAMCISKAIYWFNPFIWYAFKQAERDREISCDASVLEKLDENSYTDYGSTIINCANQYLRSSGLHLVLEFGGKKSLLWIRIAEIARYQKGDKRKERRSMLALTLIIGTMLAASPFTFVNAKSSESSSLSGENVVFEDLSSYFKDCDGSFVLYDLNNDQYHIYNYEQSALRVSPDSTYKIYSALFALEYDVIQPTRSSLPWKGIEYPFKEWNKDQDMNSAMRYSVSWYFQELDRRQGIKSLKENFERINYGNEDLSGGIDSFWAESSLKISPIEQVQLLKRFYLNDLGSSAENVQAVKDALLLSRTKDTAFFGKTGTGAIDGKDANGWFIGFVEEKYNTYFFAVNIKNGIHCSGSTAAEIAMTILEKHRLSLK